MVLKLGTEDNCVGRILEVVTMISVCIHKESIFAPYVVCYIHCTGYGNSVGNYFTIHHDC